MLAWQVQETCRRALMSHLQYRRALAGDLISFAGQAVTVLALLRTGHHSLVLVFAVMIGTSLLAAVVQAAQAELAWTSVRETAQFGAEAWRLGKFALQGSFLSMLLMQAFPWTLAMFYSASAAAGFQAVVNLLALTNPIMLGIGNLIIPATARASLHGLRAAHDVLRRYATGGAILLAPYLVLLVALPKLALTAVYGSSSPYLGFERSVRIYAVCGFVIYVGQVFASHLSGLERIDLALRAHWFATIAAVVVGLPLTATMGMAGAVWGTLIANSVRCFLVMALSHERYVLKATSHREVMSF